ncbi:putative ribonuclease H-like domain-containing protein [Tanacetum coccineum]
MFSDHLAQGQMTVDDLLQVVPQLMSRIDSLETDLKQTKLTMGNVIMKLVKKVKKLEGFLKRRNVILSYSEEEETKAQGRKSQREEQVEDISPNTLEAAKTLSRVASLKPKSIDKGRRYKRRKETKGKKVVTSLDFQEEVNTAEGVNTGSIKVSTVSEQVSTGSTKRSIPSPDKGQRAGKAPMIIEEAPKKSKEQILQEEASLAEAIRLDSLQKEEVAKQVHLDSLLAQRIAEEEELNEQQKKRRAQVQFEAQHYTDEDWDLIRAKIEANAELSKSMLGSDLQGEDFAKKMVDLVNQRKKYFAEERARAKRNKPMTQSQLKTYMMNYLKNQETWKLSQLKNLSFEEVKEEFDKLVKHIDLKRFGEEIQTKTSKRLKSDEAKDVESTKKSRKRRKHMARKGLHKDLDKDDSEDSNEVGEQEESVSGTKISINHVPVAMKSPSIATYKIIKQGEKGVYQIVREDETDIVYINFGAMLKDISIDDLTELYRIVMNKYGMDGSEDELEKVFWKYLKNMFEEPLSTDPIWSALAETLRKEFAQDTEDLLLQAGAARASSTNYVNIASIPVNTASPSGNVKAAGLSYPDSSKYANQDDSHILALEDIYKVPSEGIFTSASYDDEGAVADFTNLETIVNIEPKKISQALEDESWVDTMQEELLQFKIQKVWILVNLPLGKKEIGTKWVYRNKKDERGIVVRNKARLVAQGHRQEEGIDYDEVFAPVARIEAIRIFLAFDSYMGFIVYQMNVKSPFLYGTIDEEVHVSQPLGFIDPKFPKKVCKVVKALYGLHQAPRAWYANLSAFLEKSGYRRGTIDKTLFIKKDKKDIMLVQVYVDDIIFGFTKKSWCDKFEALMKSRFQMSSMGELTFFLGLHVKTASTPIETQKPLVKDKEATDVDVHLYRSMIGSLMYLTASRPDIMFAGCAYSRFQVTPNTSHLHAVKRIFRYLKGKTKLGLWYSRVSAFNLEAYSDSNYAGANLDRKSTTGGCQFLGRRLISWQCKKQTIVATSTTEAEYVAVANCCG